MGCETWALVHGPCDMGHKTLTMGPGIWEKGKSTKEKRKGKRKNEKGHKTKDI